MQPEQDKLLEKLFRENYNKFELYACALLQDQKSAQTAVQTAFLIACTNIDDLMASPNPVGWMMQTIKNVTRNMRRRRNRELMLVLPLAELTIEPGKADSYTVELWDQCKTILSPEELDLVKSVVIDGISYVEKAEELGITMWACYKKVERALKKLRKGLSEDKK